MDSSDATQSPGRSAPVSSAALAWWRRADRGWKAVWLSAVLLAAVQFGARIPW